MAVVVDEVEVVPADGREGGDSRGETQEAERRLSPEAIRVQVERVLMIGRERAERLRAT